jgi:hypothetical protein
MGGPWSPVETRLLDDATVSGATLANAVRPWADIGPIGGSAQDNLGNFYFTDLKSSSLMKRTPDGAVSTVIKDQHLHWVDAPFIDGANRASGCRCRRWTGPPCSMAAFPASSGPSRCTACNCPNHNSAGRRRDQPACRFDRGSAQRVALGPVHAGHIELDGGQADDEQQ